MNEFLHPYKIHILIAVANIFHVLIVLSKLSYIILQSNRYRYIRNYWEQLIQTNLIILLLRCNDVIKLIHTIVYLLSVDHDVDYDVINCDL